MSDALYGTTTTYQFDNDDFSQVIQSVTAALLRQKDYYPVEATLLTVASNGQRYSSNTMTLYRHDPIMIKAQLETPINEQMEDAVWNAARSGDFTPIKTISTTLSVRQKKNRGQQCPKCSKWYRHHFNDHLLSCGEGKWCSICRTEQSDMVAHKQVCRGDLFPCRVCGSVLMCRQDRTEHEKECRRPDSSATSRNVRPRYAVDDPADDPPPPGVTEQTAIEGLFRKISLTPPPGTGTDFEGALINHHPQLVSILNDRRGKNHLF